MGHSRIRVTLMALAAIAMLSTAVTTASAGRGPSAPDPTSRTEQLVQGILEHNPGSRRIDADSVELEKGVVMTAGDIGTLSDECSRFYRTGYLCLYQFADFGGYAISFSACGFYRYLKNYYMPDGRNWANKTSSIINAQYGDVTSKFYTLESNGSYKYVIAVRSGNYLRNLAWDSDPDGGSLDNKIDRVWVC